MSAAAASDTPRIEIAVAVVEQDGRFLVGLRESGAPLAGYWEFPGGKIHAGESPAAAAERECLEETGIAVRVVDRYTITDYDYDDARVRLHFFACRPIRPDAAGPQRFRWVTAAELPALRFPPANAVVLAQLAAQAG